MEVCAKSAIRFDQTGQRLSGPRRKVGGTSLSITAINDRGGAMLESSAVWSIERSVRECTEFSGLLGAKIQSKLEPPTPRGGPFDLWILVKVPMPDTKKATDIPKNLIALPVESGGMQ
ncbi:MAG: hypothetical protein QGG74_04595 [Phycisphaerales bacterium]|nr:hypothetical protein [Phycisphaerales bacterium]